MKKSKFSKKFYGYYAKVLFCQLCIIFVIYILPNKQDSKKDIQRHYKKLSKERDYFFFLNVNIGENFRYYYYYHYHDEKWDKCLKFLFAILVYRSFDEILDLSDKQDFKLRAVYFDKTQKLLKEFIFKIITSNKIDMKVQYGRVLNVYVLCVAVPEVYSDELLKQTKKCLEKYVQSLYEDITKSGEEALLENYFKQWTLYRKATNVDSLSRLTESSIDLALCDHKIIQICFDFHSMDQIRSIMLKIDKLALDVWRRLMIGPMEKNLVQLLLQAISLDRGNVNVQQAVVHSVIQSFVEVERHKSKGTLKLYQNLFESKFLKHTAEHYKREANRLLQSFNCSQYMQKVLVWIEEENVRSRKFLHCSSYEKVTKICQEVMVASHIEVLHSVTRDMVQNEQLADLGNMYVLVKPLPSGLAILVKEFENYIERIAVECIQNLNGKNIPHQFVEGMLNIHQRFSEMVRMVFQNNQEFVSALDRACLTVVNFKEESQSSPKASEWLAKYMDHLLRKSAKGLNESEIEDKLITAIIVFRYIEDKDIFQKFYSQMLTQRLIHGLSVAMDAEAQMIAKLKSACGYEFTSKLQQIFNDIGLSKDLTTRFTSFVEAQHEILGLGFQIQVVEAGAWSFTNSHISPFIVPRELEKSISLFEKFYSKNFTGRKLSWLYHWATVDVKLHYLSRPYTVTMTVHQLVVLLHFNGPQLCTVNEIEAATQLTGEILNKTIKSLVDCSILTYKMTDDLRVGTTQISLNMAFTNKRMKFKISAPIVEKHAEIEQVNSTVQQDRKYSLQCTIVRIMKTRKIFKHSQLIEEVINQTRARFAPKIPFIKIVIEQLIEKQFLQRTENADEYAYLAS